MKLLIISIVIIFALAIWFYRIKRNTYRDPPNGTEFKYDDENNEFSVSHLEGNKRITKTYKRNYETR